MTQLISNFRHSKDNFCGHRPNGNDCSICSLKGIANQLNLALKQPEKIGHNQFLRLALLYLVFSFENHVYYHLSDFTGINLFPRFMSRLGQCVLDPRCDHDILLEFHPRLVESYRRTLDTLKLSEHTFSSDDNSISVCVTFPKSKSDDNSISVSMTFPKSLR